MRPNFVALMGVCAIMSPIGLGDDDHGDDSLIHDETGSWVDEFDSRPESWVYIRLPRFGIASLQDVVTVGTPAHDAWLNIGEPLEAYEPIAIFTDTANNNNGAITMLMLPERCLGDFDGDGSVGWSDALLFTQFFLNGHQAADLTGDGFVDIRDQILFLHLATVPCVDAW